MWKRSWFNCVIFVFRPLPRLTLKSCFERALSAVFFFEILSRLKKHRTSCRFEANPFPVRNFERKGSDMRVCVLSLMQIDGVSLYSCTFCNNLRR